MAFPFVKPLEGIGYVEIPVLGITSNVYVVGAPGEALLVDCGSAGDAVGVIAALEAQGYRPRDVRAIVVTHGHADHFGGAAGLAAWSGAPVWAHVAAAPQIEDHWGGYISPGSTSQHGGPADWEKFREIGGDPVKVGRALREGDVLECGRLRLEVLHTPGHDRGEITLFEPTGRLAFLGDLVQGGMDASKNWLGLFTDIAGQRQSLKRVADLEPEWLFKGHRPPRSGGDVAADLSSAAARLDAIERAVTDTLAEDAPVSVARAAKLAFRKALGMDVAAPPNYALVSVEAFLIDLAHRGLARQNADLAWEPTRPWA